MKVSTVSKNKVEESVIDLTGKEHHEDGRPPTPVLVHQIKEALNAYPEAKASIYFWLANQAKASPQRVH
jgi:hypothetical protein